MGVKVKLASIVFLCVHFAFAYGQASPPPPASSLQYPLSATETECEGNPCVASTKSEAAWEFHGVSGDGKWNNGAFAKIVIERFDADGVIIRRIDLPTSSSNGLTAVYTGRRHGNRVEGAVVWSWSGHWNDKHPSGHWSATVEGLTRVPPVAASQVPASLTECETDQCAPGRTGGCRWTFHGAEGESRCRDGAAARLVIRQFDANGVVVLRTDLPDSHGSGLTAVYVGTWNGDRITGYGTWSWPGHWNNRNPSGRWFATVAGADSQALPPVPPPLVSPEVHPDGSVTFRAFAPRSQEVLLEIEGSNPVIMQKDDLGVWSYTTTPLEPDYYGYLFRDTGVPVIDPSNPLLWPNLLQTENMVHVPGPASLPWEVNDGPQGVLHHHFYKSAVIGEPRDFYVYTPPGYDPRANIDYPVLYLLHGFGQLSKSWIEIGLANVVLDNLIDQGKARPMIVVMPVAYGGKEILGHDAYWNDDLRNKNFNKFTKGLLTEIIPQVESNYRVKKDRDARAIAGLSMGGAESLLTGLNNLDEFSWVGSFSSGGIRESFDQEFPGLSAASNAQLHLLWVACGVDDPLSEINREIGNWLGAKGIRHISIETPGKHTWMVWRRNLASFAPLLFR